MNLWSNSNPEDETKILLLSYRHPSRFLHLCGVSIRLLAKFISFKSAQWGAGVMIISWSCVEIFRYLFYAFALVSGDSTKKTPFPLFWLRYSLFAVLYPTGITGEMTCFINAAHDPQFHAFFFGSSEVAIWIYARILPFVYLFGSPFMILNMIGNRKSAFKKRFAKPPPPPRGIVFPVDSNSKEIGSSVKKWHGREPGQDGEDVARLEGKTGEGGMQRE